MLPVHPPLLEPVCPIVQLTANEQQYLPVLSANTRLYWPELKWKSMLGAQVRQETCPSLKSKLCWSPHAELKTSREYGFGLGQLTVTAQFDNFKAAKKLNTTMKDWTWDNRYSAEYQLNALIFMDKFNYGKFSGSTDEKERLSFSFAAYNGGIGGVLSDKSVCRNTAGCDPNRWFDHVERTSKKAKVAVSGYGQPFFTINRLYVTHITGEYHLRYMPFFGECYVH